MEAIAVRKEKQTYDHTNYDLYIKKVKIPIILANNAHKLLGKECDTTEDKPSRAEPKAQDVDL